MLARFTLVFLPLCLLAQEPSATPPPEVEHALRERVTQFFQAHVDGAFRKAYELVADDFKDFYFAGNKTRYKSFSIESIRYFDNFTRAKVLLNTEVVWEVRMQKAVAKVQTPASWKLQDGKWMWYDDPQDRRTMPILVSGTPGEIPRDPDGTVRLPDDLSPTAIVDAATAQLKATTLDKSEVTLSSKASSDKVVLHNGAPGFVNLTLEKLPPVPGLTVVLDKTQVGPNGDAAVKIACQPCTPTEPVTVNLTVEPFGRRFPVLVRIQ
jgi:hypothetical protein